VLTGRGWWVLFACLVLLIMGIAARVTAMMVMGIALVVWVGFEWLMFALSVQLLRSRVRIVREVRDERGIVGTLWKGRAFRVRVAVEVSGGRLPFVMLSDMVPFTLRHDEGPTRADGPLSPDEPLEIEYRVRCPMTGLARFEGVRAEISDLQGFFASVMFLRAPVEMRILPPPAAPPRGGLPLVKRDNALLPPGIHRLRKAGSGTELLDLRDYQPGDPPRTIAWKVSARRGKLMTRDFETEVPVRCTLFVDISTAVRVPSPASGGGAVGYRPLDRLVEIAGAVVRGSASQRDLTGLCLFDEEGTRIVRPGRGPTHVSRLMALLGEAAALSPLAPSADPEELIPVAHALAREVYPDLLEPELNAVPTWLEWLVGHPAYPKHPRGWTGWLDRNKLMVLFVGTLVIPLAAALLWLAAFLWLLIISPTELGEWAAWALLATGGGLAVVTTGAWLIFFFSLLVGGTRRAEFRARKQVAAVLCVLHDLPADALQRMLEDDDFCSLHVQRFLAEHHVPFAVPLFAPDGRYLLADLRKVDVLAKAIVRSAAHGVDNELYVIMADLLDLDGHLGPLLQAVKVALARHHQVVVICAWPRGVPLPTAERRGPRHDTLHSALTALLERQLHEVFTRLQREFARLSVPVVCAASDEPVPLVLRRINRLRGVGGRR
jgi:uncharacterized protein (DUF58 family)